MAIAQPSCTPTAQRRRCTALCTASRPLSKLGGQDATSVACFPSSPPLPRQACSGMSSTVDPARRKVRKAPAPAADSKARAVHRLPLWAGRMPETHAQEARGRRPWSLSPDRGRCPFDSAPTERRGTIEIVANHFLPWLPCPGHLEAAASEASIGGRLVDASASTVRAARPSQSWLCSLAGPRLFSDSAALSWSPRHCRHRHLSHRIVLCRASSRADAVMSRSTHGPAACSRPGLRCAADCGVPHCPVVPEAVLPSPTQ